MTHSAITLGETRGAAATRRRLRTRTVAVASLDASTRGTAFALFHRAYDGADRARFERDLAEKRWIILLRDGDSGQLKGFSTVHLRPPDARCDGTVVFSGDTVIDPEYWGQKELQRAFAALLLREKLRAPGRPLYWFLISKGWRTYLLLAHAFPRAVPRHDRPDDGPLRRMLHALAAERFGAQFDAETGVIRYDEPHERVRAGLAPVTDALLADPHVRFFVEHNPGHAAGDELACLAEVRLVDVVRVVGRLAAAAARRARGARTARAAPGTRGSA